MAGKATAEQVRVAVIGTGGIGGYFGGRLAAAGHDVRFVARGAHLEALRRDGLRVDSTAGGFAVAPVRATDDTRDIGEVDYVLLCVKTWQLPSAIAALKPLVGSDTAVVTFQNGVEAPSGWPRRSAAALSCRAPRRSSRTSTGRGACAMWAGPRRWRSRSGTTARPSV
ncbi:2-dehydropantoate 2-reductase N-terminal domain-containing protein [Streptomyces sp. YIM 121038]|uniref:ketopantoate reductase family protein n=1 Tax=Streptomyces sp. YIM 121038 TaxID=2136401 RepID=UPI002017A9EE|nr:2-dehydropantoate 2-reductase N-terminal domain-containing protein [Streptomyces sp. YIM 121038]